MADMQARLILSLVDRVTAPARGVQQSIRAVQDQIDRNNAAIRQTQGQLFGAVAAATGFAVALSQPVQAATAFEGAMADVRKVVNFESDAALAAFRSELLGLSRELPVTVQGLTEIAAAAGQAGIAVQDIIPFTEAAAKVGTAFDITADEAGTAMSKLMTGLDKTLPEALLLTDAMNHLSNSQASSAAEILDVVRRVGAQGTQFGFAAEETAAFASAMIAAGAESEVAATSFRNMGASLTRGESATARQSDALAKLGLDAAEVARRMQEDAVGTTVDVMKRIAALPAEVRAAVSTDLFGAEARALGPLLTNMGLLDTSLGLVGDSAEYAGSSFAEFENRNKTFGAEMARFRNLMSELSITLGEALIPAISDTMEQMRPVIGAIIEWASANGELIRTVASVAAGLLGLRVAVLGMKLLGLTGKGGVLWAMSAGLSSVGAAAARVKGSVGEAIALQQALARLNKAPVGLTPFAASMTKVDDVALSRMDKLKAVLRGIAGITGLSAVASGIKLTVAAVAAISAPVWGAIALAVAAVGWAGYQIYKNWDRLASIVKGVASAIGDSLSSAIWASESDIEKFKAIAESVKAAVSTIMDGARSVADTITSIFEGSFFEQNILSEDEKASIEDRAREMTTNIIDAINGIPQQLGNIGQEIIDAIWAGMEERMKTFLSDVATIPGRITGAIGNGSPSSTQKPGSTVATSPVLPPHLDARARGGPVLPGRPYLVGEQGEEIIFPSHQGFVATTRQARELAATVSQISAAARAIPALPAMRVPDIATPRSLASVPSPVSIGTSRGAPAGRGGPVSVTNSFGDIVIQGGANASADELSQAFGRQIERQFRSSYGDLG